MAELNLGARTKLAPYRWTAMTKARSSCSATVEGLREERLYSSDYNAKQLVFYCIDSDCFNMGRWRSHAQYPGLSYNTRALSGIL